MKNLKNLGEILNKEEQQSINGGWDTGFCDRFCPNANPNDWRYDACNCGIVIDPCPTC